MEEKKDLILLIESDKLEEFVLQVFKNQAGGEGFYTMPLSIEEEKALLLRATQSSKNNRWYNVLTDYISHYPLTNESVSFLITKIQNSIAIRVICTDFKKHGYAPAQAEEICNVIKKGDFASAFRPLLDVISTTGRIFSKDLHKLLCNIDEQQRKQSDKYAEVYEQNVKKYQQTNGLFNLES